MARSRKSVFSQKLAQAMRFQNISQTEFAQFLAVSRVTVHAWCSGSSHPTVERLVRIADVLGVTTAYLLGEDPPVKMPPELSKHQRRFLSTEGINSEEIQRKFEDFNEYVRFLRNRTKRARTN